MGAECSLGKIFYLKQPSSAFACPPRPVCCGPVPAGPPPGARCASPPCVTFRITEALRGVKSWRDRGEMTLSRINQTGCVRCLPRLNHRSALEERSTRKTCLLFTVLLIPHVLRIWPVTTRGGNYYYYYYFEKYKPKFVNKSKLVCLTWRTEALLHFLLKFDVCARACVAVCARVSETESVGHLLSRSAISCFHPDIALCSITTSVRSLKKKEEKGGWRHTDLCFASLSILSLSTHSSRSL